MTAQRGEVRVSVLGVTYNQRSVRQALDSVLGPTHRNLERVVVDDASTDRSAESAERLAVLVRPEPRA